MVSALDEQDTTDTLALLVQCEKKLSVMLEVLGKAATGSAPKATSETTFIAEPVFHSNNVRVRPSGPAVKLEALPSTRSASSVSDVRVDGMGREGMGPGWGVCVCVGGGGCDFDDDAVGVWGRLQPADVGVPLCACCSCIGVGGDLYGAGCTCVLLQSEDKEGGESDDESTSERVLFDRSALKKKAKKKEADELRRRETEARRAAMAAKIAVDLDKVRVTCPEAVCCCMAVMVCRLADCHRARFFLLLVVGCCRKRQWSG